MIFTVFCLIRNINLKILVSYFADFDDRFYPIRNKIGSYFRGYLFCSASFNVQAIWWARFCYCDKDAHRKLIFRPFLTMQSWKWFRLYYIFIMIKTLFNIKSAISKNIEFSETKNGFYQNETIPQMKFYFSTLFWALTTFHFWYHL